MSPRTVCCSLPLTAATPPWFNNLYLQPALSKGGNTQPDAHPFPARGGRNRSGVTSGSRKKFQTAVCELSMCVCLSNSCKCTARHFKLSKKTGLRVIQNQLDSFRRRFIGLTTLMSSPLQRIPSGKKRSSHCLVVLARFI